MVIKCITPMVLVMVNLQRRKVKLVMWKRVKSSCSFIHKEEETSSTVSLSREFTVIRMKHS